MRHNSNRNEVKAIANILLFTDVFETKFSPAVVQHPFTSSGIVGIQKSGGLTMLNIVQSEDDLHAWRTLISERINSADNAVAVYSLINKPYALTFLKFAEPYLSRSEFSELFADAWIRSENPNCDPNLSKTKLLAMFKDADPLILMDGEERARLEELDDTVTVYRGVTSYNADNIKALSWTLDYKTAEWFAHRFDEDGTVYEAQIPEQHICALFNGRNESEVIVDPNYLIDIVETQEMDIGMSLNQ